MKLLDLFEAPLKDLQYIDRRTKLSDTESIGSFSDRDAALIKKYIAQDVYKTKLKKLPVDLYVYLVDDQAYAEMGRTFPEQEIFISDFRGSKFIEYFHPSGDRKSVSLESGGLKIALAAVMQNREKDPSGVHFIMGDNFSDSHQIAPTPWIIAHRFVHTWTLKDVKWLQDAVDSLKSITPRECYTMKSATQGKMSTGELGNEILTQHLVTGKITLDYSKYPEGRSMSPEEFKKLAEEKIAKIEAEIAKITSKLKGRIFYI